jgi:MFS family permease
MIWAFEETGTATSLVLVFFFAYTPSIALSPLAGVVVDRVSRKAILIMSDAAAAAATLGITALFFLSSLELWHIYLLLGLGGGFRAFQWPAFAAATTVLVPKRHYGRASGMMSVAYSLSELSAPITAALLLAVIGLGGVLLLDIATFLVAVATLLAIAIPAPRESKDAREAKGTLRDEISFGFRYVLARRSLFGLLMVFLAFNVVTSMGWVLFQPMVLARTGSDEVVLGSVLAIGGAGGIVGGAVMSIWGGPKRRIHGLLGGLFIICLGGVCVIGVGSGFFTWALGLLVITLIDPVIMGSSQAIWQAKVPPDLQGRVFSVRFFIALIGQAPIILMAGPLADHVFEPLMSDATGLAASVLGSGDGSGMSLLIFISGVLGALVSVAGYASRSVRDIEDILPDHDEVGGDDDGSEEALEEGARHPEEGGGALE